MINKILIACLRMLRPILGYSSGVSCKYPVTCTEFAIMQLKDLPIHKALPSIARQLLSCNPFW